jgi:ABC-type oligopeptide transport system substrate-binding subunit
MKIPYKLFVPILFLLVSCGGDSADTETIEDTTTPTKNGGVFRMSIGSFFKCVHVNEVQKHEESQVYWQIFEGLVKYNSETLKIEPSSSKKLGDFSRWVDIYV